ncbi:hypothetical protein [Deinococcus sp. Leaf326]|uniref:hypothetical protein n=1 Tax=Deinococcus sp. Leaf326 TaxID=1736338 RepID=UPI0006F31044|nr:hypothetical protein [Deinococcus sp. Leaf326]KQR22911.1 hypothetical protein ASF71_07015 [Deinococcus sp. Leaf326]
MTIVHRESNTLALAAQAMQLLDFGGMLIKSGMLPSSVRTPESAVAIMVKGIELGLPAMAALNGITVIQGKPTVSPQLMLSLINRSGQLDNIEIDTGVQGATVTMKRRGRTPFTAKFGPVEAKAMGLDSKDNYRKQAPVMYQWRAVAACARVVFPDVIDGLYTPEELGADVQVDVQVDEDGAMTVAVQETKATPQPAAPERTLPDPQVEAWANKVRDMSTRVRKVAPEDEVNKTVDFYDWQRDAQEAQKCHAELKELGLHYAPAKPSELVPASNSDAEAMVSAEQISQLQAIARSCGATVSDDRAQLWGYSLNAAGPIRTKELTESQAVVLLGMFGDKDADERKAIMQEAKRAAKGVLL